MYHILFTQTKFYIDYSFCLSFIKDDLIDFFLIFNLNEMPKEASLIKKKNIIFNYIIGLFLFYLLVSKKEGQDML